MKTNPIIRFNFTYALPGGAWIERADHVTEWLPFADLVKEQSLAWIDAQLHKQGWMTGSWITCGMGVAR